MNSITLLSEEKAKHEWNEFVQSLDDVVPFSFHPELFYFYRDGLHWKPYYFLFYQKEKLIAVLPLVDTGRAWVSLPHFSYGGWLSGTPADAEEMIQHVAGVLNRQQMEPGFYRCDMNEVKTEKKTIPYLFVRALNPPGTQTEKVTSYMQLPQSKEEFCQMLSSNLRRKIRKAERHGFYTKTGSAELLRDFYQVYALRMHQLGSPAYGHSFFRKLIQSLGGESGRIFVVYHENRPVGGALLLSYNGFYESAWFATNPQYNSYHIADFLHSVMIDGVISRQGKIYSFGRSTADGSVYVYKNHWPVQNYPLFLYNTMNRPTVRNHSWLSGLWKYSPRIVADRLGPVLIRHIY